MRKSEWEMAKSPGPGKCVHCLAEVAERNWDHVFPQSWYPDSTPPNIEKWEIPSCIPCNSSYGKIENDFRILMGLCLERENPASRSIVEAAIRSIDPAKGKNPSDAQKRLDKLLKLMSQTVHRAQIREKNLYPGMPQHDIPTEDLVPVLIPADYFPRMAQKIVRGIFYIQEEGKFIEPPYEIAWHLPTETVTVHFQKLLDEFGTICARGPGLVVQYAVTEDNEFASLFRIAFWEQVTMYATVTCE